MAYYAIIADTATKDIVRVARIDVGPGPTVPNIKLADMTLKVEVFATESHPLWVGLEAAWPDLNAGFKLNASNNDIESR